MNITISGSFRHFSTFTDALVKAIRKQHSNKNLILFYNNHVLIGKLDYEKGLDIIIGSTFITHFDKNELKYAKKYVFL